MAARIPYLNARLQGYSTTIFTEMSNLAVSTGSINLGQGFPDEDGPAELKEIAAAAVRGGEHNQYAPGTGVAKLRYAVSAHQQEYYGLSYDPDGEVLITAGATEAIAASILALCEVGDEVILFEPFYDSYAACIAMAGAQRRVLRMQPPDWSFDPDELASAINARTRVVVVNSPHNPTGKVFSHDELACIAMLCIEHNLIALTDEVYEHMIYEGRHESLASHPGMAERTIVISSGAKTFSFTGWKVGWACAPRPLIKAVQTPKQFLTYVTPAPLQLAIAEGLATQKNWIDHIPAMLQPKRDLFSAGLANLGFTVFSSPGTYYLTSDTTSLGEPDASSFCWSLPERLRVAAIPSAVFYDDPSDPLPFVRWAFCKRDEVLLEALARLEGLRQ